jgi:transcription antitermination protein NusB
MASNRHLGRIIALQTLYEFDFRQNAGDNSVDLDEILARNLERYDDTVDDKEFVSKLVHGTGAMFAELDETIQPIAPEWPLEQIARIDKTILRLALYELLHMQELVPPKVAINEAVELAKAFGGDNSSKFVNGVLGTAYRTLIEGSEPNADPKDAQSIEI